MTRIILTVEEAADRLGIGRTLMYSLIREGAVESFTIGRLRKVSTEALDAYVHAQLTSGSDSGTAA